MTVPQLPLVAPGNASLCLNLRTLQLCSSQGRVDVTDPECQLLKALAASADQRLDTPSLLEHIGKHADAPAKRALEVQLVRLRKKFEQAGISDAVLAEQLQSALAERQGKESALAERR
ncbi:MAG: hypothetical protein CVU16_10870, partial [Betaproteobacteria bacterium HGW-Betaproteobacteria-10]